MIRMQVIYGNDDYESSTVYNPEPKVLDWMAGGL